MNEPSLAVITILRGKFVGYFAHFYLCLASDRFLGKGGIFPVVHWGMKYQHTWEGSDGNVIWRLGM